MNLFLRSWMRPNVLLVTATILVMAAMLIFNIYFYFHTKYYNSVLHYYPNDRNELMCSSLTGKIDWEELGKTMPKTEQRKSDHRIYFLDTSCKGGLDSREACAIESAAIAHPDWLIFVYFLDRLHRKFIQSTTFQILKRYKNVRFIKPLFFTYKDPQPLLNSTSTLQNLTSLLSDWLRFFILKKHGGVFLDLDMIVTRSFTNLPNNWVARQSLSELGAGAMRLSNDQIGRTVAQLAFESIHDFGNATQSLNKETVIKQALQRICLTKNITTMNAYVCHGFAVLEPYVFYLVNNTEWQYYLRPGHDLSLLDTYFAFAHKHWSSKTIGTLYEPHSKLAILANKHCPKIYDLYGPDFGV